MSRCQQLPGTCSLYLRKIQEYHRFFWIKVYPASGNHFALFQPVNFSAVSFFRTVFKSLVLAGCH